MPRPSFKPTKEQRKLVKSLAAIGTRHDQITVIVGLRSPKTLRKHFRKELSLGSAEALATVTRVAYEMAVSGKHPEMTEYWISRMDGGPDSADVAELERSKIRRESTCEMIFVSAQDGSTETDRGGDHASAEV